MKFTTWPGLHLRLVLKSRRLGDGRGMGWGWDRACRAVGNLGGETKTSSVPVAFRKTQRTDGGGEGSKERGNAQG